MAGWGEGREGSIGSDCYNGRDAQALLLCEEKGESAVQSEIEYVARLFCYSLLDSQQLLLSLS